MHSNFKIFEGSDIDLQKLSFFLKDNYNQNPFDIIEAKYSLDYLKWLFSNGGVLGIITNNNEWTALFCVGAFTLRHGNEQCDILYGGPICVHKKYTFKGLAQKVVKETASYAKSKYNMPVIGPGAGGVKKDRIFKNFGIFLTSKVKKPQKLCFSSNNFHLCDDSLFLKKFRNKNGVLFYYEQEITHNSKAEKWAVLASYFTVHCWKSLIYDFYDKEGERYDNILVYENLERKGEDLTEIGFEKLTPYNLYIDSPVELPEYFLYYNLFTY